MPQMKPMMWINLSMMIITTLLIMMTSMIQMKYNTTPNPKMNNSKLNDHKLILKI